MFNNQFNLAHKTALVTGCKKGIGKAMAIALASAGADVIGVSASLELSGSEVETEIVKNGGKFKAYQCDFSDRKALYSFIKELKETPEENAEKIAVYEKIVTRSLFGNINASRNSA